MVARPCSSPSRGERAEAPPHTGGGWRSVQHRGGLRGGPGGRLRYCTPRAERWVNHRCRAGPSRLILSRRRWCARRGLRGEGGGGGPAQRGGALATWGPPAAGGKIHVAAVGALLATGSYCTPWIWWACPHPAGGVCDLAATGAVWPRSVGHPQWTAQTSFARCKIHSVWAGHKS